MPKELRAPQAYSPTNSAVSTAGGGAAMHQDDDAQYTGRSRPVSFYDNFKDVTVMAPCVTSAVSVGNLSQEVRDNGDGRMNSSASPSNNNNRVSSAMSVGNVSKIHGTKVTGAVSTGNIGWLSRNEKDKELGRAPSMANCLSTTVPVNLAASQIAGRHTPTRNSLRHSRMIVMNRTGNITRKTQPPLLRHRRLARTLAAIQTILGITVTSLALWLLLWAPNLPLLDNPYWSGMPLLLSGSFGICLLCCFKKEYPGMSPGFCLTSTKIISVFLAVLATVACIVACVAAALHLIKLTGLECTPARVKNATCACRLRTDLASPSDPLLKYIDLNCPEVEGVLTILLILSSTCNGIGAIVAGWYCYLHWATRDKRPTYVKVRTNSSTAAGGLNSRPIYNPNLGKR